MMISKWTPNAGFGAEKQHETPTPQAIHLVEPEKTALRTFCNTSCLDNMEAGVIELPYPHKILWPNGRTKSYSWKAGETRKHRDWAYKAAKAAGACDRFATEAHPVRILVTLYPKPRGPLPDRDNAIAACKAYFDGIADATGGDDRHFHHAIQFGERCEHGKIVVCLS